MWNYVHLNMYVWKIMFFFINSHFFRIVAMLWCGWTIGLSPLVLAMVMLFQAGTRLWISLWYTLQKGLFGCSFRTNQIHTVNNSLRSCHHCHFPGINSFTNPHSSLVCFHMIPKIFRQYNDKIHWPLCRKIVLNIRNFFVICSFNFKYSNITFAFTNLNVGYLLRCYG